MSRAQFLESPSTKCLAAEKWGPTLATGFKAAENVFRKGPRPDSAETGKDVASAKLPRDAKKIRNVRKSHYDNSNKNPTEERIQIRNRRTPLGLKNTFAPSVAKRTHTHCCYLLLAVCFLSLRYKVELNL